MQNTPWWEDTTPPFIFLENTEKHPTDSHRWDILFMRIAYEISKMSKCASRQVGSVLVKDRNIISMGFNGSPAHSSLCQNKEIICPRRKLNIPSGQGIELCPAQHSEENSIHMAAKQGISTNGATLYAWCGTVCQRCAGALINAGIKRIVCLEGEADYDRMSKKLLKEADIKLEKINKNEIFQEDV